MAPGHVPSVSQAQAGAVMTFFGGFPEIEAAERLSKFILAYESDTFSASRLELSEQDAAQIAAVIIGRCQNRIDGAALREVLDTIADAGNRVDNEPPPSLEEIERAVRSARVTVRGDELTAHADAVIKRADKIALADTIVGLGPKGRK